MPEALFIDQEIVLGELGALHLFAHPHGQALGLHIKKPEGNRWLLHPNRLQNLGVQPDRCAAVCEQLLALGVLTRSRNKSGTIQARVIAENERGVRGSTSKVAAVIFDGYLTKAAGQPRLFRILM